MYVSMLYTRVNISHFKKKWTRCDQKFILAFLLSTHYSCQILTKLQFSVQIFEK